MLSSIDHKPDTRRESNEDEDDLYLHTLWSWFHPKSVETALDLNKLPILCERGLIRITLNRRNLAQIPSF